MFLSHLAVMLEGFVQDVHACTLSLMNCKLLKILYLFFISIGEVFVNLFIIQAAVVSYCSIAKDCKDRADVLQCQSKINNTVHLYHKEDCSYIYIQT